MKISIDELTYALHSSWTADTAYNAADWSVRNPARGQCVVSALIVQDYFGGDLQRYEVKGVGGLAETHYANVLSSGTIVDTTASQYNEAVLLTPTSTNLKGFSSIRDKRLSDPSTYRRYELLKARVQSVLS